MTSSFAKTRNLKI